MSDTNQTSKKTASTASNTLLDGSNINSVKPKTTTSTATGGSLSQTSSSKKK